MNKPFRPEILAPAGNLFKLETAVRYGADAVYIAGRHFGLRSAAENFTESDILHGCAFAHGRGVKVYVVLNGFLFDEELDRLPPFLTVLEKAGVDAVIVSDLGVVETVRRHAAIPIHLSTQASALNSWTAKFWRESGVQRIVLGREVSIAEAAAIKAAAAIEVEMFVHGAMCMAYSGHCTISNYTAGRDSNRGGCIQSCRMKYSDQHQSGYFLSAKDLIGIDHMQAFMNHQIDSLKIEGRMKSPLYVATTARAYAHARDKALAMAGNQPPWLPGFDVRSDLETMSHRDYSEANLLRDAGADSIYNHADDEAPQRHSFLGTVVDVQPDRHVAVLLRTPLFAGEEVEVLLPGGANLVLDSSQLRLLDGSKQERLVPNRVALFPFRSGIENHYLVRKRAHAEAGSGSTRLSA